MKKFKFMTVISLIISFCLVLLVSGCGSNGDKSAASSDVKEAVKPVTLTVPTYMTGVSPGAKLWKEMLAEFDKQYGDKIKVKSEEIAGDAAFVNKMTVLLSANNLPDVILSNGGDMLHTFVPTGKIVDLTPYLAKDPELKAQSDQKSLDFNSIDGKVYALPRTKSLMGYYYNKELFQKAGIDKPAATWPEFWEDCKKLKAAGITPLAMDTLDSGWITSLMLGALIGTSDEAGNKFMNTVHSKNYNTAEVIQALKDIQTAFQNYTSKDAIGGNYDLAATGFFQGRTAMIFNGPWMESDLKDTTKVKAGLIDNVEMAIYPNNGVYNSSFYGDMITAKDQAHIDAALTFLKFFHSEKILSMNLELTGDLPVNPNVKITDEIRKAKPLVSQLLEESKNAKWTFTDYSTLWYQNVQDILSNSYPELGMGKMTPEQFAQKLTDLAQKNQN